MIEYTLRQNELTEDGKTYNAQVINLKSYTFNDIANYLIRQNIGLSRSAIYGVWEGMKKAVEEIISEGGSINTELFNTSISIKGVFDGMDDGFDGSRHKICLNLHPGVILRNIPKKLKTRKFYSRTMSLINTITDVKSGSVNDMLTPGMNVRIIGRRLKIAGADPSCGIYFVPENRSEQPVKIEFSDIVVNKPSEIIAVIPILDKGTWNIRLVTQFRKGKGFLKTLNNITFDKPLNVA